MRSEDLLQQMNPDAFHAIFDVKVERGCRGGKPHLIN